MSIEVSKAMSLNNLKLPLIKDGNFQFHDESMKRILTSHSNTAATGESNPFSGTYSSYQSTFSSLDVLSESRSIIPTFGAPMNPYVNSNMIGYPMIHPYLLESMQQVEHLSGSSKPHFSPRMFSLPGQVENYLDLGPHPRRKNATRETTSILKAWLNEHQKNPYPTKGEKIMLAVITKMTLTQVSTWFANARRRLKKENKMTWSPNHKSDDEIDDVDDNDSSDLLNNVPSQSAANEFLLKLSKIGNETPHSSPVASKSDSGKPKIWSIADITSDSCESQKTKMTTNQRDGANSTQSFPSPYVLPQPFLQYPSMLLRNKELYQLYFSNIVSNMHRCRPMIDHRGRSTDDEVKPQDSEDAE